MNSITEGGLEMSVSFPVTEAAIPSRAADSAVEIPQLGRRAILAIWAAAALPMAALAWLVALAFAAEELISGGIPTPANRDMGSFLDSHAGQAFLHGAWGWFALIVVLGLFNTVLGEELLFRGFLLPRMNGAFGRRDWVANGILFAGYHLHMPWAIPTALLDTFILAYPSKRYRSAWIGIAVHSAQTVVITAIVLSLVV